MVLLSNTLDLRNHHFVHVYYTIAIQNHDLHNIPEDFYTSPAKQLSLLCDYRLRLKYTERFFGRVRFADFVSVFRKLALDLQVYLVDLMTV